MAYAELLARAGYTVVEYDIEQGAGPLQVVPDKVEVRGMLFRCSTCCLWTACADTKIDRFCFPYQWRWQAEVVSMSMQVEFLHQLYESLRSGSGALLGIDLSHVFLAGHSRGGKLAALHWAAGAAYTVYSRRLQMHHRMPGSPSKRSHYA